MRSLLGTVGALLNRAPIPHAAPRRGGLGLFAGARRDTEAQMAAMGSVGTLFAIVSGTAADVGQVDWHMHRLRQRGAVCEICECPGVSLVEDHLALRVWNRPNDFYTGQEFRESFSQHVDLTGEGWWVVERGEGSGLPAALWCPRPDRMEPIPDPENFLSGYEYRSPDGQRVPLDLDEVVQIRLPNPLDPYRGLGPVQALMVDLDATRYTAEWNRRFFMNSAEPGGVIEVPAELGDKQFRRLQQQWGEQHRGVRNAHRVGILENGMKWVDRRYTQKDMQFSELRRLGKEEIREAFRYPLFRLGTVQDVNRSTAEASDVMYARAHLVPRLKRIKGALNNDFLPMFGSTGQGVEFVYANPVPADREADNAERDSRTAAYKTLVDAGVDPGDAAAAVGLPPMRILVQPATEPTTTAASADVLAQMVQKLYLGTPGKAVITWAEARTLLNAAGADLDPAVPEPAPPATPVLAAGPPVLDVEDLADVENVQRWVAVEEQDDDTCQACRDNHGKLYRTRGEAYADYPGGEGYVNCEGRGNCRGRVVRRGRKGQGRDEV